MASSSPPPQQQTSNPRSAPLPLSSPANTPPPVDLSTLPTAQLNNVKNQLTSELQHLTTSFQQLKQAQVKFRDCGVSVRDGLQEEGECYTFCSREDLGRWVERRE